MNSKKVVIITSIVLIILSVIGVMVYLFIFNKSKTFQYDGLEYLLPKGMEASNESNGIVLIDSNNNKYNISFFTKIENNIDNTDISFNLYNKMINSTVVKEKKSNNLEIDDLYNLYNKMSVSSKSKTIKEKYNDIDVVVQDNFEDNKVLYIFKTSINNYCIIEVKNKYENISREIISEIINSLYLPIKK